jgi:hypothetical protein
MSNRQIGNYRIVDYVGSGGFGSVFKAEDIKNPSRIVAVKELHKKHTRSTAIKQRFFQEAVAMARLDHPNLPRLFTFGEDSGCYYLVMEFVSGTLLSEDIERRGAIPEDRARAIIAQVLQAVSYAHRNGIIHRDLKPDNIMIVEEDGQLTVKVLDFGIARLVGGESLTMTGEGFGTPSYMSPERLAGTPDIDQRTDIYSLGIILFEMLTGKAPFESKATDPAVFWSEIRRLHETESLPSLSAFSVSPDLERIVRTAAAKLVNDRYGTADEMMADLAGGRIAAKLLLATQPTGADVFVDNLPRGVSDEPSGRLLVDGLTPGVHAVRVEKQGYGAYKIDVRLEGGNETTLQVSLAARATVAIPPAQITGHGQADTAAVASGDDVRTVLCACVLDQLTPGSKVVIGAETMGQVDENGRATLMLEPGDHSVLVTSRSGATRSGLITVANSDRGATRMITLPLRSGTVSPGGSAPVTARNQRHSKKPVAVIAAAVVMIALAATAYVVIKGPGRTSGEDGQESGRLVSNGNANEVVGSVDAEPDSNKSNATSQLASLNANRAAPPKRESTADANRTAAEPAHPEPIVSQTPTVAEPPVQSPADQTTNNACINVIVIGPGNRPAAGVRVGCIEQLAGEVPIRRYGKTGPRGRAALCGLKPGGIAKVAVLGPDSNVTGGTDVTVMQGSTPVVLRVSVDPGARQELIPRNRIDDYQPLRTRRRPGFPRKP